ncbi:MAG: hypothetical protein U0U67_16480 [Chitinophagales bacterium]
MKQLIMILSCLVALQLANARPHKTVKVYTVKPAPVRYGKPYYCKVQPTRTVVVVKPACPSSKHIWIDGDWIWDSQTNQYIYIEGKWIIPSPGAVWIPGHWKNTPYGWFWKKGHWQ